MSNSENRDTTVDFNLQKMTDIYQAAKGKTDIPHRHNYYTVVFLIKGTGEHIIDFNRYPLTELQVFFVSPGQIHQVDTSSEPSGWVITFSRDFLIRNNIPESFILNINLFRSFNESPPLLLDDLSYNRLKGVIEDMMSCLPEGLKFRQQALAALLQLFLIYCNNSCSLEDNQTDEKHPGACMVRDFKRLLDLQYRNWHKVANYATEIHVTTKHLGSTIKQMTGKTAKEWIQERISLESKRLLLHSQLSIKEIGYQVGFEEPVYFSTFFKKQTGQSPSQFRKNTPI